MNTVKTHNLLVRGVDKATKKAIIKVARENRRSVNSELLIAIVNHANASELLQSTKSKKP